MEPISYVLITNSIIINNVVCLWKCAKSLFKIWIIFHLAKLIPRDVKLAGLARNWTIQTPKPARTAPNLAHNHYEWVWGGYRPVPKYGSVEP